MLETEIAYFAPNNFGYRGYAMIGPLLLFYNKLIISNPAGMLLKRSYRECTKTSLTEYEFMQYVQAGTIIPIGFETFFDEKKRVEHYPSVLQIGTELDRDIIENPVVRSHRIVLPDDYKSREASPAAIAICKRNPGLVANLKELYTNLSQIPSRYSALTTDPEALPRCLRPYLKDVLVPADQFPYMFVYDYLNNRYAIDEFQKKVGKAATFALHNEYHAPYEAIDEALSTKLSNRREESSNVLLIGEVLKEVVGRARMKRLTSDQIDEFRRIHRDNFILFIRKALTATRNDADPDKKRERIVKVLEREFDKLQWHVAISPEALMNLFTSPTRLNVPSVPHAFYTRSAYNFVHRPLQKSRRWLFHFLNPIS